MTAARIIAVALVAAASTCGCATRAPRIGHPVKLQSYCGSREARLTGVASVLTSTSDELLDERPTATDVAHAVESGDGLIAYYDDQRLALPRVAQSLGEPDGYVRVRAAGVPPVVEGATTRRLFLLLDARGTQRWYALRAYDTQDVCVEGHRDV